MTKFKRALRVIVRNYLPMSAKKRLALMISRQSWLDREYRAWLSADLLRNWQDSDLNSLHKFQWQNHIAYANTYEIEERFGFQKLNESRKIFFNCFECELSKISINPRTDIDSIFDVGCSLGYLLRHMEKEICPNAKIMEGVDIDEYAIEKGRDYLSALDSMIKLHCGDIELLKQIMGSRSFDVVLCLGVLMYLKEKQATEVVRQMLAHTNKILAISSLAHPVVDNQDLDRSTVREIDQTFIHNIDKMVLSAGGRIFYRRWDGAHIVDGNSIYFVFAV